MNPPAAVSAVNGHDVKIARSHGGKHWRAGNSASRPSRPLTARRLASAGIAAARNVVNFGALVAKFAACCVALCKLATRPGTASLRNGKIAYGRVAKTDRHLFVQDT